MNKTEIINTLKKYCLKVTPQRIAVLDAAITLKNHPTADNIAEYIKSNDPNIATGTVYKILETFVDKGIIKKVQTESDIMRYDAVQEKHHHLYCSDSERIEDLYDDDLNMILDDYFRKKRIPNFKIEDIKLQIIGRFTDNSKSK